MSSSSSSSNPVPRIEKPQILLKSTLRKTKKFLTKSLTYLKPKPPTTNTMDPKLHEELHHIYTTLSEKRGAPNPNPIEAMTKKKGGNVSEIAEREKERLEKSKEERRAARKQEEVLAQKMKDLEMMDLKDDEDVEEVLHYYSRLTCPAYVEIVDQFFMDMYTEFHVAGSSIRRLAPESNYSSMRSLAPLKL